MAGRTANISSIDAVQGLKLALQQFEADVQDALILLELESRRPVDWIENDRARYWPREMQKASDAVSEARLAVDQSEAAIRPADRQSSYDALKQLERAKRRLRLTEAKIEAVRKWKLVIRKEVEEFKVQAERLKHFLESDLQRSIAILEKMSEALAGYVQGSSGIRQNSDASLETVVEVRSGIRQNSETLPATLNSGEFSYGSPSDKTDQEPAS